ncbi:enolase-phosphatase E1 isoform X2 [Hoplias malabaricus]|uniref:enolase-phosphatase E1 isoform X2 n=1 Tax=Hoplias malabaricus TaxID=27720 RepID=UPI0034629700
MSFSWLFVAHFIQTCLRGAELEMISVWLLFLKLLRATAGVKRPNGNEMSERKDSLNQPEKEQENLSEAVAMETSHFSEMADLKDYNIDLGDTEVEKCQRSREDESGSADTYFPECLETKKSSSSNGDEHESSDIANDCTGSVEANRSTDMQSDNLAKETENEESHLVNSTPDIHHPAKDQAVEEDNNPSTSDLTEHRELVKDQETEQEGNSLPILDVNGREHQDLQDSPTIEQEDNNPSTSANESEHKDSQESPILNQENSNTSTFEGTEHQEPQENSGLEQKDNSLSAFDASEAEHQEEHNEEDNHEPWECPKIEQEDNNMSALDATETEPKEPQDSSNIEQESALEQQIKELAISDASTESCHDNDRDDLSDCLQVEMAIVSSDSDAEEQWKSMFSPVVDKGEDNDDMIIDLLGTNALDVTAESNVQEEAIERDGSYVLESNAEHEDDALVETTADSIDILEQPECPTECDLDDFSCDSSIHYQSLTKIPEDGEDLSQSPKHNLKRLSASTSELDKRLPQDYCVHQEMKSENISTEHLDFKMARQQWQKIEEQNKGQTHQPRIRQSTSPGGHNFMYTPVRTLDRPKRDPDPDCLSLGDYQYTQFSPCSEDSGLDDTSYRSPYDEPETPVEREIRETMEREQSFRQERAMSRPSSGEPVQRKPRPANFLTNRSDPEERRRMYNTPEDRCRSQRSPSSRTPTFSITSSPSSKPNYHEMVANNVIILEPDSYPTSPRHRGKGLLSPGTNRFHEWPSDMTNVIILETSNLIIRSASEFCLSTACQETQESTFQNNPFFKLRSHSTQSLVDQEIKVVRQRDEEFRRQRAQLYTKEKYDTVLVSPSLLESFTYDRAGETPAKCKSSPSSPLRIRKMDRSVLSCDQKEPFFL